jgi:hypothetical protein
MAECAGRAFRCAGAARGGTLAASAMLCRFSPRVPSARRTIAFWAGGYSILPSPSPKNLVCLTVVLPVLSCTKP